jgi:hypothetical protein
MFWVGPAIFFLRFAFPCLGVLSIAICPRESCVLRYRRRVPDPCMNVH